MPMTVTWKCDKCDFSVTRDDLMPEMFDYNDSWPPEGIEWCRDKEGEHLFCEKHHEEWRKKIESENPGVPWVA